MKYMSFPGLFLSAFSLFLNECQNDNCQRKEDQELLHAVFSPVYPRLIALFHGLFMGAFFAENI